MKLSTLGITRKRMVLRSQNSMSSVISSLYAPGSAQYRISMRFWTAKAFAASIPPNWREASGPVMGRS